MTTGSSSAMESLSSSGKCRSHSDGSPAARQQAAADQVMHGFGRSRWQCAARATSRCRIWPRAGARSGAGGTRRAARGARLPGGRRPLRHAPGRRRRDDARSRPRSCAADTGGHAPRRRARGRRRHRIRRHGRAAAVHALATPEVILGEDDTGLLAFAGGATLPVGAAILCLAAHPRLRGSGSGSSAASRPRWSRGSCCSARSALRSGARPGAAGVRGGRRSQRCSCRSGCSRCSRGAHGGRSRHAPRSGPVGVRRGRVADARAGCRDVLAGMELRVAGRPRAGDDRDVAHGIPVALDLRRDAPSNPLTGDRRRAARGR